MNVTPVRTHSIVAGGDTIFDILDTYLPPLRNRTVVAVTSKIVSLCEGSVAPMEHRSVEDLIEEHADYYLPKDFNKYGFHFTITNDTLISSAGIDKSNGNGSLVLWPKNPQESAHAIREHLVAKHRVPHIGVVITDSKSVPLRLGTVGTTIAHAGFSGLNDYRGTPDLFDYELRVTRANIAEGLAAAACVAMGEGRERTPLAIIEDVPFVAFEDKPTEAVSVSLEEDLYAPIFKAAPWQRGKKNH